MNFSLRLMRSSRSSSYWLFLAGAHGLARSMGFLAGALVEEDFLVGAMVAKACGERGGHSVAVRVADSRPGPNLNLRARRRRRRKAAQSYRCVDALAARGGCSGIDRAAREHRFSLRLPQRARMAVARPVFDGAAEYGLRRCYRFFLARIGAVLE